VSQSAGRRNFLKLIGGALGISALSYYLGVTDRASDSLPVDSLSDYADNDSGFPVFRGPYLQKNAKLAAFLFNGGAEQLNRLCDQKLNVSDAFACRYVPISSSVMMLFADMLVSSLDDRDSQTGLIPETEVSFWILTIAMQKTQAGEVPHHLAWFIPYLLVDEGNAIATGREVFGFNKLAAWVQKPDQIQIPKWTADVLGFKQFGSDIIAQRERLLDLKPFAQNAQTQRGDENTIKITLMDEFLRNSLASGGSGLVEFAARFINGNIPLVFLKQFRDAQNTHKACYQRLIEAPLTIKTFYEGGIFLEPHTLTITSLASHPFAQKFGFENADQQSTAGAWMKVDFVLGNGIDVT
jgi:hypothetical protein